MQPQFDSVRIAANAYEQELRRSANRIPRSDLAVDRRGVVVRIFQAFGENIDRGRAMLVGRRTVAPTIAEPAAPSRQRLTSASELAN